MGYLAPDHVHVISQGRIIRSGGRDLAQEILQKGYGWIADAPKGEPVTA